MTKPEHKEEEEEEGNEEENEIEEPVEEEKEEEKDEKDDDKEEEKEEKEDDKDEREDIPEQVKQVKKRKCVRKKTGIKVCLDEELDEEEEELCIEEFEEEEEEEEEAEEDEEEEGEDDDELFKLFRVPSILSAVYFQWEDKEYEFEELCDPGFLRLPQSSKVVEFDLGDKYGIIRYKEVCNNLNILPISSILRALKTEEMDLSYRNLDNKSIKAICAALNANTVTTSLLIRWSDLRPEDCIHLGRLLSRNIITNLDFTGSRLNPESLGYLIAFLTKNEVVTNLTLSKCNIGDEGMKTLAYVLSINNSIEYLDLSYNKLESSSADSLALVFMSNNCLTHLNLRYNYLFEPSNMKNFFRYLSPSTSILHLDLSWNGLNGADIGGYIGNFLRKNLTIAHLDLSDNRLQDLAITEIRKGMLSSRTLTSLKLGKNPLTPTDVEELIGSVKYCRGLQVLDLEDIWLDKNVYQVIKKIQRDREFECNFAGILRNYEIIGPDYPKFILRRAQFEAQKPKNPKKRKDFGHLIWTLGDDPLTKDDFMLKVQKFKAKVAKELYPELIKQFQNPKNKLIDVKAMRDKYLSIFPDSTPPPPPKPKKGKKEPQKDAVAEPSENITIGEEFSEEGDLILGESTEDLLTGEESDENEIEEEAEGEEGEESEN